MKTGEAHKDDGRRAAARPDEPEVVQLDENNSGSCPRARRPRVPRPAGLADHRFTMLVGSLAHLRSQP
jgi:hypothetical protein